MSEITNLIGPGLVINWEQGSTGAGSYRLNHLGLYLRAGLNQEIAARDEKQENKSEMHL
jgi:hypothetical protein